MKNLSKAIRNIEKDIIKEGIIASHEELDGFFKSSKRSRQRILRMEKIKKTIEDELELRSLGY